MNAGIRLAAFTLATGLVAAAPAQAGKLYKWVDEEGNVTYAAEN